jgi:hypothetical protein
MACFLSQSALTNHLVITAHTSKARRASNVKKAKMLITRGNEKVISEYNDGVESWEESRVLLESVQPASDET